MCAKCLEPDPVVFLSLCVCVFVPAYKLLNLIDPNENIIIKSKREETDYKIVHGVKQVDTEFSPALTILDHNTSI